MRCTAAGVCAFDPPADCLRIAQEMPPSGEGDDRLKRALEKHCAKAVGFLILAKSNLSDDGCKELIKRTHEIVKQCSSLSFREQRHPLMYPMKTIVI